MDNLVQHIIENYNEGKIDKDFTKETLKLLKESRKDGEEIAIIGMSVKIADIEELSDFWSMIEDGRDCIREFPKNREREVEKFVYQRYGEEKPFYKAAYMEDISHFDYDFFRCTPKEAELMDPNHKVFLQTAWRALEDSGYLNDKIHKSMTGIFLGYSPSIKDNYQSMINEVNKSDVSQSIPYNLSSIAASRLAYILDLKGSSMVIDSACSSGLSAINIAIKSLKDKECDMAIAGGVRLHLLPVDDRDYQMGIESDDGYTRAFDGKTTGSGVGEGSVAIVLKRLSDAERDHDHIYAVIKGIAMNQDGKSLGITAPNPESQVQVLVKAWENAGINPESIDYIETHGTATVLGDPIEINSINNAFSKYTEKKGFCAVGSIKSNIGHLFECAGMVSVVKAVMALNKKIIPKTIHYNNLNEKVDYLESSVYINTINREWKKDQHPRRCGVSAFGYSGTNGHLILEEYIEKDNETTNLKEKYLIPISAETKASLEKLLLRYELQEEEIIKYDIADIAKTLSCGRMHFSYRIIYQVSSTSELNEKIKCTNRMGLDSKQVESLYGYHKCLRIKKENKKPYELCIWERDQLSNEANSLLGNIKDETVLNKLMELYCKGADIDWKECADLASHYLVGGLPVYQFDYLESWIDVSGFDPTLRRIKQTTSPHHISNTKEALPAKKELVITGKEELSEKEYEICNILSRILGFKEIDVFDNFFEIGLDSISMMKIVTEIAKTYHITIDYKVFTQGVNVVKMAELIENGLQDAAETVAIKEEDQNLYDVFGLTNIQRAYVLGRQTYYSLGNTSTHMYLEYETELDIARLERALNKTIQKHPMLRAVIHKNLTQQILKEIPYYTISVDDMQKESLITCEKRKMELRQELSHEIIDTETWPLFRIKAVSTEEKTYLFIGIDLLIADGISLQILLHDLMEFYQNESLEVVDIGYTFKEYMKDYLAIKGSKEYLQAKDFWTQRLQDIMVAPQLPIDKNPEEIEKPFFARQQKNFGKGSLKRLRSVAKMHGVTVSAILCTAYAETLRRWSSQKNFVINIASYNRYGFNDKVNEIVGDFTAVMLLCVDYDPHISFWDKVSYIQNNIIEAIQNRYYDGVDIISDYLSKTGEFTKALFPVVFTSVIADDEQDYMKFFGKELFGSNQTPQVYLDNQARAYNGEFIVVWDYIKQVVNDRTVGDMFIYHNEILNQVMNEIDIVAPADYINECIINYNNTFKDYQIEHLVPLFKRTVKKLADKEAIVLEDCTITFSELDEKTDKLANYLIKQRIGRQDYVAVITERKIETIINIIGIIKAGAAYVPIDISYPEERKRYILENNQCRILLTADYYEQLNLSQYSTDLPDIPYSIKDVMYTIYTSGSTGMPKGVVETHEAAINTIMDINQKYHVTEHDKLIGISSFCFDLSVYDVFATLITGATLVMVKDQRDINNIIKLLKEENITLWNSVPAIMNLVAENAKEPIESLRLVMLSGDWIPLSLPNRLQEIAPSAKCVSLGGATEGAIWSIYYDIDHVDKNWISIPYGKPLANQMMYIMDEELTQCPMNVIGEICIGGMGVAKGYCGDEEKTKKAFIKHPQYGYLYRTGDYGIMREDGYIEFMGRRDSQVKVNGYRVELGEIEKRLTTVNGVKEAHVVVNEEKGKSLSAFITTDGSLDKKNILEEISKYLPAYMIPKSLTIVDKFELTANGKINYRALKMMEMEEQEEDITKQVNSEPVTDTQKKVLQIIEDVSKNNTLNLNSRLFDIGIDSILIISIITKLNTEFGIALSIEKVFGLHDINDICLLVDKAQVITKIIIPKAKEKEYYEISDIQKELYLSSVGRELNRAYNIFSTVVVYGKIDMEQCAFAAKKLVERHESLRTSFHEIDGNIVQKVHEHSSFDIKVVDSRGKQAEIDDIVRNNLSYFTLDEENLFRITLILLEEEKNLLLFEVHHIIVDGISLHILMEDFIKLYNGISMEPIEVLFKDYVEWNNKMLRTSLISKEIKYWMKNLKGFQAKMELPKDYFVNEMTTHEGKILTSKIPASTNDELKEFSRVSGYTIFMNMFAIGAVVLSQIYQSDDIIIGIPASGRMVEEVKSTVGMFVNTLPIRIQFKEGMSYLEVLENIKQEILNGTENLNFSMNQLLRKLQHKGTTLYDTIFSYQYYDMNPFQVENLKFERYDSSIGTCKVPLEFSITDFNEELVMNLIYSTELFMDSTIIAFRDMYLNVLEYALSNKNVKLEELKGLCRQEETNEECNLSLDFNF